MTVKRSGLALRATGLALLMASGLAAGPALAQDDHPAGDPVKGKTLFNRCIACHTLPEGGPNRVGPNLWGVIGRQAGSKEGFNYSPAMKQKGEEGLVWTEETLSEYLTNPRTYIPGNRMVFVGFANPQDRLDIIAYLKQETTPAEGAE